MGSYGENHSAAEIGRGLFFARKHANQRKGVEGIITGQACELIMEEDVSIGIELEVLKRRNIEVEFDWEKSEAGVGVPAIETKR